MIKHHHNKDKLPSQVTIKTTSKVVKRNRIRSRTSSISAEKAARSTKTGAGTAASTGEAGSARAMAGLASGCDCQVGSSAHQTGYELQTWEDLGMSWGRLMR